MNGPDGSSQSFDPLSWLKQPEGPGAPKPAPAGGGADAASFDPSTWAAAPAGPPSASPPPAKAAERNPQGRRTALALASGIAVLLAGAATAYLGRSAQPQAAAPAAAPAADRPVAPGNSRRTFSVLGPDKVLASLTDLGIDPATAQTAAQQVLAAVGPAPGEIRIAAELAPGEGGAVTLASLEATRSDGSGVLLTAAADGSLTAQPLEARLATRIVSARGEMDNESFYSSAVKAGIADSVISDFAAAFSFEVDFQRDIKPGDIFEGAFEQAYNPAGEPVGSPRLLFVSLRLESKSLRFYSFTPPGEGKPGWFDANGRSNVRSLMRTPIDGARVTSQFGYRIHPVQGFRKMHRGTDFGAPAGTNVYASSGGEIVGAGPDRCAGNLIKIQHDNGWLTKYFHLSRFAPGITVGTRVSQGQVIGQSGNTGTCTTGPHLHYEVWIDGEPVDSMQIDTGTGVTLEGDALAAFRQERDRIDLARSQRVE